MKKQVDPTLITACRCGHPRGTHYTRHKSLHHLGIGGDTCKCADCIPVGACARCDCTTFKGEKV